MESEIFIIHKKLQLIVLKSKELFFKLLQDAFKDGKVLSSNPNMNHSAALFGTDGQHYFFKDSGPRKDISLNFKYEIENLFF